LAAIKWRDEMEKTFRDLKATRDLLGSTAGDPIDPGRQETMRHESDTVAAALGTLSTTAPDDEARTTTRAAEQALGSYTLAIDAEQLLRSDAGSAEDALADANVARRARATELDNAINGIDQLLHPPEKGSPPAPA
jgi:hypothetical protein